jgi:hypothetical protein
MQHRHQITADSRPRTDDGGTVVGRGNGRVRADQNESDTGGLEANRLSQSSLARGEEHEGASDQEQEKEMKGKEKERKRQGKDG